MNVRVKALVAGIVLAASASGAHAAIASPFPGPGELFLSVFDPSQKKSYHQDLNVDMFKFLTDASYAYRKDVSWSIPLDSRWGDFYSAVQSEDMVYNVVGGDGNNPKLNSNDPTYGYLTTMIPTTENPVRGDVANVTGPLSVLAAKSVNYNQPGAAAWVWDNGTPGYYPSSFGGDFAGQVPAAQQNDGPLGSSLNFWLHGILPSPGEDEDGNPLPQLGRFEKMPGTFTLTPTALNYETAVIPIPAAFWLFGSALAGLVGFSARRRPQA